MKRIIVVGLAIVVATASLNTWAGVTTGGNPHGTTPCDSTDGGNCNHNSKRTWNLPPPMLASNQGASNQSSLGIGMPVYDFKSMLASLSIHDTPVSYAPPFGPRMDTTIYYNEREADQPATFDAFNLGQKWTISWLSYIQDNPNAPGSQVLRYVAGGGGETYSGYNPSTGAFTPEVDNAAVLVMTSTAPVAYELRFHDGSKDVFSESDGKTSYPRKVFLTRIVDAHGNALTLHYDSQLQLTSVTDAIGQSTTFQYGNAGNPLLVTGITDPFGRHATLAYDSQGRLVSITDEIGMVSTFAYAGTGTLVQSMTTPYGTTRFAQTQGAHGDPTEWSIQATDPLGYTERTEYHMAAPGVPFSASQTPAGMSIFNAYLNYRDSYYWNKDEYAAACTRSGASVSCDYSKARMKHFLHEYPCCEYTSRYLESMKKPLESMVWYDYAGQPTAYYPGTLSKPSHIGRVLDDGSTQLTTYAYNAQGNVTETIDPDGRETVYTYAPNGVDVVEIQQKDGAGFDTDAQYTYNDQHEPLTYTDAAGKTATFTYNARGQRTSATDPLGNTTTDTYNDNGYLTSVTDALGHVKRSFTYDAYGRVATVTDSRGYTLRYRYDALNRVIWIAYPDGTRRKFTWNKLDLASVTDREGCTTTYTHDADRNLIAITDPMGHVTDMTYYPSGKLHTMTDPNGNVTTWTRDIEGRVIAKTYADGKGNIYTYDNAGRLLGMADALGQTTSYTYDPDDLLTGVSYTDTVNPTANAIFRYDASYPRMVSMTDGLGTTTFSYVPAGKPGALKLQSVKGPFGLNDSVSYAYDADGRVTDRTTDQPDRFTYDALGRVRTETNPLGNFVDRYLGVTRQLTRQQLVRPNGLPGFRLSAGYDGNFRDRQLRSLMYQGPWAFVPTEKMMFTHSAGHQLLSKFDFIGHALFGNARRPRLSTYRYDRDDRLRSVTFDALFPAGKYNYDAAGNLLQYKDGFTFNATANDLNQLSIVNGNAWQYDADGNLLNNGRYAYSWDAANRLIKATNLKTGEITSFAYDGLGRRLVIEEQGANGTRAETHYLWCGNTLCGSRSDAGDVLADYYTQGEQRDHYTQAGQRETANLYYVKDQIGSVVGVMGANGDLHGSTTYTAYGATRHSEGARADFGYAGMFYDQATGLYLTKYRAYMPAAGRWLSRDPIGVMGGLNIYAYAGGDPTSLIDPTGLISGIGQKLCRIFLAALNLCGPYLPPHHDPVEPPEPPTLPERPPQTSGCDSAGGKDREHEPERRTPGLLPIIIQGGEEFLGHALGAAG